MNRIQQALTTGASLTLLVLATALAGCRTAQDGESSGNAEKFLAEDETSAVTRLADAQSAAGAGTDATLRPYHFGHAALNPLGREKLDLMLAHRDALGSDPLVVYLDVDPKHDAQDRDRRDDVTSYLLSHGLTEAEFALKDGPNPDNTFLASSARGEAKPEDDGGGNIFEMLGAMAEGMSEASEGMSK